MTNLCWEQEVLGPLESGGGGSWSQLPLRLLSSSVAHLELS